MAILFNIENAFDKIQYAFMIKNPKQVRNRGEPS